ncbi:hypothetical protein BESB_049010 [Besnoitia besnoiti]|uniref:Uncharacterized protein n=1 Tax=Besnoitia besnoiti TaxID=94643 RepID=A0A2A9MFL1_BESBE|nr:hypothetical protein BESB_049010 [Besnoitia besnoiti]PFH36709.1 hypothetical protein BESB_049010 [Besnoitia besnoiti]
MASRPSVSASSDAACPSRSEPLLFTTSKVVGAPRSVREGAGGSRRASAEDKRQSSRQPWGEKPHRDRGRSSAREDYEPGHQPVSEAGSLHIPEGFSRSTQLMKLRNGHYRRICRTDRNGNDSAPCASEKTARAMAPLGDCTCCGVEDPSQPSHRERICVNCVRLEAKLRDMGDRREASSCKKRAEEDLDMISRLRTKVEELQDALRTADNRITTQRQVEQEQLHTIWELKRKLSETAKHQCENTEVSKREHANHEVDNRQHVNSEIALQAPTMEDVGIQTKKVGVAILRCPQLRDGIFVQVLIGEERKVMALRVDYQVRLLVLARRALLKFIPVLALVRIVTAPKDVRRLLADEGVHRKNVTDEELTRVAALFVTTAKTALPLMILLSTGKLRDRLVLHLTQLRFSAELERGHVSGKTFQGDHLKDGWLDLSRQKKHQADEDINKRN